MAYDDLAHQDLKTKEKILEEFSFGEVNMEVQRKSIIELAFEDANKQKSLLSFNHFIFKYGENHLTDKAKLEIDNILYDNVIKHNSIDSLYLFKRKYPKSQYLLDVDEQIVTLKFENCKKSESLDCLKGIKTEFPKTKQLQDIDKSIGEISERIATNRFEKCKLTKSIQCLDEIIADYPKTEVVKLIKEEKDKILFESHCNSKNLDSIYLFINTYKKSAFKDQANLVFKKVIEDSISRLSSTSISENWDLIESDFYLKYKFLVDSYLADDVVKTNFENLLFSSLNAQSSKSRLDWFNKEFPNSKHKTELTNLEKQILMNENVGFIKGQNGKFGLVNMTTGVFLVDYFFDDVYEFSNGLAAVQLYGLWGYINKKGETIIPFVYNKARSFKNNMAGVEQNGLWFFINKTGVRISKNEYLFIGDFDSEFVNVQPLTGAWFYIDRNEKIVSPQSYYYASSFTNGLAAVLINERERLFINKKFEDVKNATSWDHYNNYARLDHIPQNIVSFEYSDRRKEYILNRHIFYNPDVNETFANVNASAADFSENELMFDFSGTYLVDGNNIINYNGTYELKDAEYLRFYSPLSGIQNSFFSISEMGTDVMFKLSGSERHPIGDGSIYDQIDYKSKIPLNKFRGGQLGLVSFNKNNAVIRKETGEGIVLANGVLFNNHCSFSSVTPFLAGRSVVGSTAGYFLMDSTGQKCSKIYSTINRLNENLFIVSDKGSSKYYLMNIKEQILSANYDHIDAKIVRNTLLVFNKNGYKNSSELRLYGLIDINGKVLVPLIYDNFISTINNLVFGQCPSGCNSPSVFDIFNFNGTKIKTLNGYYYLNQANSSGLKFTKSHYDHTKPRSDYNQIIDDVYYLPNY
jgi:hypothetical protein